MAEQDSQDGETRMRGMICILLALFALSAQNAAQARPRDDVMSRAFRCAAVTESRQWLDCYYGAAQPLRASLGLPAAPASQLSLVENPPANGAPSDQPTRDMVMSGAFRCNSLTDERQWLNCYYGAAQPMRTRLGLSPAGPVSSNGSQQASTQNDSSGQQQFGMPPTPRPLGSDNNRVVSALASYSFDRYGLFTVKLANGQKWRQVEGDTSFAHWKKNPASYRAVISRGAIGSYNLIVDGNPGMFKVTRVE
jgi:hypothetical protein